MSKTNREKKKCFKQKKFQNFKTLEIKYYSLKKKNYMYV